MRHPPAPVHGADDPWATTQYRKPSNQPEVAPDAVMRRRTYTSRSTLDTTNRWVHSPHTLAGSLRKFIRRPGALWRCSVMNRLLIRLLAATAVLAVGQSV